MFYSDPHVVRPHTEPRVTGPCVAGPCVVRPHQDSGFYNIRTWTIKPSRWCYFIIIFFLCASVRGKRRLKASQQTGRKWLNGALAIGELSREDAACDKTLPKKTNIPLHKFSHFVSRRVAGLFSLIKHITKQPLHSHDEAAICNQIIISSNCEETYSGAFTASAEPIRQPGLLLYIFISTVLLKPFVYKYVE